MGVLGRIYDGLTNALTGMGGGNDPRRGNVYAFCPLGQQQIEAAYRGSGLMRKVIDIPAFDMVREWRDWQADNAEIEKLEAEERRLGLQSKIMFAEILRGLGGGALILGTPGDPALPMSRALGQGALAYIHVVNRWQLTATEWVDDPTDPLFGGPRFWTIATTQGQRRIHPSRVVCFRGDPVPNLMGASQDEQFWGESRVQRVLDAVQNSDTAQTAFASLISKARNVIIGVPGLLDMTSTVEGEQLIAKRMNAFALAESLYQVTLKDNGDGKEGSGESVDHRQVVWAGIPDIMYAYATFVAAVADIPVTRLLGKAAEGMSASGQSQQKDWDKMVMARQKLMLRPCLDQLDAALIPSALGRTPPELWWQFAPLDTPTEKEEADRFKTTVDAIKGLQDTATIPDEAFAKAVQNTIVEGGWMPGLEAALDEVPEGERYGSTPEPDESDPSALQAANENEVAGLQKRGAINADQAMALLTDAAPRSLYVSRKLLNADEFIAWAKGQGFTTTTPADDLRVTICYSKQPVDWLKMGEAWDWNEPKDGKLVVSPGGARIVERLGDKGAVVLLFTSSALSYRHGELREKGASFDFDEYQPHVTITYSAPADLDLAKVEPYRGKLVFGPEVFAEVVEDWEKGITEDGGRPQAAVPFGDAKRRGKRGPGRHSGRSPGFDPNQPRGPSGRWIESGATKEDISTHVKRALASGKEHSRTSLGKVSQANADLVLAKTGHSIAGHERVIESSDIRHVMNSHGNAEREAARGQVAIQQADFGRISEITEQASSIRLIGRPGSRKELRLEYVATLEGREYHYVEAIRPSGQIVALKSLLRRS